MQKRLACWKLLKTNTEHKFFPPVSSHFISLCLLQIGLAAMTSGKLTLFNRILFGIRPHFPLHCKKWAVLRSTAGRHVPTKYTFIFFNVESFFFSIPILLNRKVLTDYIYLLKIFNFELCHIFK